MTKTRLASILFYSIVNEQLSERDLGFHVIHDTSLLERYLNRQSKVRLENMLAIGYGVLSDLGGHVRSFKAQEDKNLKELRKIDWPLQLKLKTLD
jgi:hypothetical protein